MNKYVYFSIGNFFWYQLSKNKTMTVYAVVDRGKYATYVEQVTFSSQTIYKNVSDEDIGSIVADVNGNFHSLKEWNIPYDKNNKSLVFFSKELADEWFNELNHSLNLAV